MAYKLFPHCWTFVAGIHRSPADFQFSSEVCCFNIHPKQLVEQKSSGRWFWTSLYVVFVRVCNFRQHYVAIWYPQPFLTTDISEIGQRDHKESHGTSSVKLQYFIIFPCMYGDHAIGVARSSPWIHHDAIIKMQPCFMAKCNICLEKFNQRQRDHRNNDFYVLLSTIISLGLCHDIYAQPQWRFGVCGKSRIYMKLTFSARPVSGVWKW